MSVYLTFVNTFSGPFITADGTIIAGSVIEINDGPTSLVMSGNSSLAGTLAAQAVGGAFTVDLEPLNAVTLLTVTPTGLLVARQGGTIAVTGIAGAVVANAGTISAGYVVNNGTQTGTISSSVSIDNTGLMTALVSSTLTLTGAVTNEAGATISGDFGTVVFSGTNLSNAGTISTNGGTVTSSGIVSASGSYLATNAGLIAFNGMAAKVVTLTSTGTLQAGTVANNIASVGTITSTQSIDNSGLIAITDLSTATLGGAVTNLATGLITETSGVLAFNGGLRNLGRLIEAGGTISVLSRLTNSGTITQSRGTLSIAGGFVNSGTATFNGTDSITGGVNNTGIWNITGGALTVTGGIVGTGTTTIGNDVTLNVAGAVAATENLTFATGVGVLTLSTPSTFAGTITNLSGHDVIDLVGLSNATAVVNAGTVTVSNNGTLVTTFTATGLAAGSLNSVSDSSGGTILTLKQPGTQAAVVDALINGTPAGASHQWGGTAPVVTYSFDGALAWSTAEQQSFTNGLNLWSAFAKITFVKASAGATGSLVFARVATGGAFASSPTDAQGNNTSSSVSIQTSAPSFANIVTFGTNDATGYGGYGWSTVLHEIGHTLGLSHPGNYNETADLATQQLYYTDTHQYTVMSYFDPKYSGAAYTQAGTNYQPETPMMFDIAAIQQIYGANTTTLAGNDIFGFNASGAITGNVALNAVYNFASNTLPIVTLYDAGINNTLDLSGYAAASTVNLNAGSFSSFNGLTRNLAISSTTAIDKFIGGSGDDVISVNANADILDGGGGANTAVFSLSRASYTFAFAGGTVTVRPLAGGVTDTLTNIQTLQFSDTAVAACFLAGTKIMTDHGEIAIEHLQPGTHRAVTATGELADIIWIGRRHATLRQHPRPWDVMPIRIHTDAFGFGQPLRDLVVSPDHALFVDGVLIPARLLINGATVVQEHHDTATWLHVELDHHDAILAQGLPTESYLDTHNRHAFDNGGAALMLHPNFAASAAAALQIWADHGMAKLVLEGEQVTRARATLIARAIERGFAMSRDPEPHLWVDGRTIIPTAIGNKFVFALPPNARIIRLRSNAASAADTCATSQDRRRLGLAVTSIEIDNVAVPITTDTFTAGWHTTETAWRWTNGDAELAHPGARSVVIEVADINLPHWTRYGLPDKATSARP